MVMLCAHMICDDVAEAAAGAFLLGEGTGGISYVHPYQWSVSWS